MEQPASTAVCNPQRESRAPPVSLNRLFIYSRAGKSTCWSPGDPDASDVSREISMLIELEGLTKTYGRVTALCGLSLAMPEGAIGLLGPNGAGKTTMIRSLLGLIALDSGRGRVLGLDIRRPADGHSPGGRLRSRGRVPVSRRGRGPVRGLRRGARGHACRATPCSGPTRCLTTSVWARRVTGRVESYSTGMKQRLKIASAIVHDPRLLILDEPTNGMDPARPRGDPRARATTSLMPRE